MNNNSEYDPKHKASSIMSTTSTASSHSIWDYPLNPNLIDPTSDFIDNKEQLGTHQTLEDYHVNNSTLNTSQTISLISPFVDFDHNSSKRRKTHSNVTTELFMPLSISHDNKQEAMQNKAEQEIDKGVTAKKGNSHKDQKDENPFKNTITPLIYLQHSDQIIMPSIASTSLYSDYDKMSIQQQRSLIENGQKEYPTIIEETQQQSVHPLMTKKRTRATLLSTSCRDTLTEDEKRMNHIASEQKRRNTIRSGFKELTEIVPTLKNINNSKSTILFKAVDYIKYLDKRNRNLNEKITLLQIRINGITKNRLERQEEHYYHLSSINKHHLINKFFEKGQCHDDLVQEDNHDSFCSTTDTTTTTHSVLNKQQQQQHISPTTTTTTTIAISALLVHKNQQKQLEELQEYLRMQQQLLEKHNIILPKMKNSSFTSIQTKKDSKSIMLLNKRTTRPERHRQYNSISIPSSQSSNNDENECNIHHQSSL